jgi:hypothetical protein
VTGSHAPAIAILVLAAGVLTGCGAKTAERPAEDVQAPVSMQLLAVLPIEPATAPGDDAAAPPPPEAGLSLTAQIYRVLADQTEFRFVADLSVSDVLTAAEVRRADGVVARAVALGKEVSADGVIFGRVFRFDKRIGTESGASRPASVWFELGLVRVSDGDVVWQGSFEQTQGPIPSNLFSWWMFWRPQPRWFSASELAGQGVDQLFADMTDTVNAEG